MATSLCTRCKSKPPNIGFKWCNPCYMQSRQPVYNAKCLRCGNPPNPGYPLCEVCYLNETTPRKLRCLMCALPPEPNMDLCQGCWSSLNSTAGNQPMIYPGSIPAPHFPPTLPPQHMFPLLSTMSTLLCEKCHNKKNNQGHPLCESCYQQEMRTPTRPNPYGNGFIRQAMAFPMPMPTYIPPMNHMIYRSQPGFQSLDSSPVSQDTDAKTLVNMGSSYVNKKVTKEKPQQPTETNYHCFCPYCYSDASRTDLFYCSHCFDKVVSGDDVCNSCRMKVK